MADENPVRLQPPIIGNPAITDIGRGRSSDSPQPRQPAIPMVLWYGADEPTPPPSAAGDLPPVPVVVHAVEVIDRGLIYVERQPADAVAAAPNVPSKPIVVAAQPLPEQQPYRFVEQQPAAAVAAAPATPVPPLVVSAQQLPQQPAAIFVERQIVEDARPNEPLIVPAVQPAIAQPNVWISRQPTAAPTATATPTKTSVASLPWHPSTAGGQIWVSSLIPEAAAPTTPTEQPAAVRVISSTPIPPTVQTPFVSRTTTGPATDDLPPVPVIAAGAGFAGGGFTLVHKTPTPPPGPAPQVPIKPLVVAAQPLPQQTQTPLSYQPRVPFIAPPSVQAKSTIITPQWHASMGGGQIWVSSLVPEAAATPPLDGIPPRSLVILAQPLPHHQQRPYSYISSTFIEAPTPPISEIATGAGLASGGQIFIHQVPTSPPAPPPAVPIKPTVVGAQTLPQQTQTPWVRQNRVDPPVLPQVPIKPVVVTAQPLPQPVQAPIITRTYFEDPKVPIKPIFVAAQPIPPQPAFIFTPKAGRWGNPPPRRIEPNIVFDVSRPPLPYGWAQIRCGFAEALPVLGDGHIYGGQRSGPDITGGQRTTADIYGGQRAAVELTGGPR